MYDHTFLYTLLQTGKMHFGYIYGFGLVGCVMMYFILNLMSSDGTSCSFDATISILGYCLLPIIIMAFFGIVINLK